MIWAKQPLWVCSGTRYLWKKVFCCFCGQEVLKLRGSVLHRRHGSPGMDPAGGQGKRSGTAAAGWSTCDTTGSVTPWLWEKRSGKWVLGPSQPSAWPYCTHGPKLQSWDVGFWNCPYYLGVGNTGFGSSLFLVVREVRVCSVSIAKKKLCLIKISKGILTKQHRQPC